MPISYPSSVDRPNLIWSLWAGVKAGSESVGILRWPEPIGGWSSVEKFDLVAGPGLVEAGGLDPVGDGLVDVAPGLEYPPSTNGLAHPMMGPIDPVTDLYPCKLPF
jgi:hypothetical protein